jgi:3-phosphoshikimate 1-carboxyvinyltransferase
MAPLVEALRALGADIQYVEQEGFLPLRVIGKPLAGGKVTLDMTQSSQFASSLVMAAPMFPNGLELELVGDLSSLPYLDMTLSMMCHFSAQAERQGRRVVVQPKPYQPMPFAIEPDWTAASYWYEMAAFSEECEIKLRFLNPLVVHRYAPSATHVMPTDEGGRASMGCFGRYDMDGNHGLQGDAIIAEWMTQLGVGTYAEGEDLVLRKIPFEKCPLHFDFSQHPDLYPTMAATCAGLHMEMHFTGLDNLALKESDRVEAMQTELSKLDQQPLQFCAHNDHRIAMALAPLSMLFGPATFDHPEVVEKSYPNFWKDASFLPIF